MAQNTHAHLLSSPADARHLLRRLAFGGNPEQDTMLKGMPVDKAFDALVEAAKKAPEPATPSFVQGVWTNSSLRSAGMTSKEYQALRGAQVEVHQKGISQLREWWLREMIAGAAPLRENMVLFLQGTLGSSSSSADMPQALHRQSALLRRMALGNIPDLLEKLATDAATMLQIGMDEYREDKLTAKPPSYRPAKFILENWSVGPDEYQQSDLVELSKALTGWLLVAPAGREPKKAVDPEAFRSARRTGLEPLFQPEHFIKGEKTILGKRETFDARSAVRFLAMQPATARRFSRLLIRYLAVEDPAKRLETQVAETYLSTGGSITAMLREIVLSDPFWSEETRWQMIKSPVHLAVGACRALEVSDPPLTALTNWLTATGQKLFDTPNFGDSGWPGQESWVTPPDRLAVRYQLGNILSGETPNLGLSSTAAGKAAKPAIGSRLSGASASILLSRLDASPGIDAVEIEKQIAKVSKGAQGAEAVRRIIATPQYQLA